MGVGKTRPLFSTTGREYSDNYASDEVHLPRSGRDRRRCQASRLPDSQEGFGSSADRGGGGCGKGGGELGVAREDGKSLAGFSVEARMHDIVLSAFGLGLGPKWQRIISNEANSFQHQ